MPPDSRSFEFKPSVTVAKREFVAICCVAPSATVRFVLPGLTANVVGSAGIVTKGATVPCCAPKSTS